MDANISNFQKFIIQNIVQSVEYDALLDSYTFNRCEISDDLISIIVQEGKRYGMSEQEARQYITLTASNIKTSPYAKKIVSDFDFASIPFGTHIRIDIEHPIQGHQWLEGIKLKKSLFLLNSSIRGLYYGVRIYPQTEIWSSGFYINFEYQPDRSPVIIQNLVLSIGKLSYIQLFYPSVVHEIIDSQRTFAKDEQNTNKGRTKKLSITQRETEFLSIADDVFDSVKNNNIDSDYSNFKGLIHEIDISSYVLNALICDSKKRIEQSPQSLNAIENNIFFHKEDSTSISEIDSLKDLLESAKKNYDKLLKKQKTKRCWYIANVLFLTIVIFIIIVISIHRSHKEKILSHEGKDTIQLIEDSATSVPNDSISIKSVNENSIPLCPVKKIHSDSKTHHDSLILEYGIWKSSNKTNPNSVHGRGTLTYTKKKEIKGYSGKIAEKGDYIEGRFEHGRPVNATWYSATGKKKEYLSGSTE